MLGVRALDCARSFAPKLSSGAPGHHGRSLRQVLEVIRREVAARKPAGWRIDAAHQGKRLRWARHGRLVIISLAGADSGTLALVATCVHRAGMVNARPPGDLHVTLGSVDDLPPPPPPHAYPAKGAPPQPLPDVLVTALCGATWRVSVAKLKDGQPPACDNEAVTI